LLCDTDTHLRAHPHSPLPRRLFSYPEDAAEQLTRAFAYHSGVFGNPPKGVWPSEGSISDEVIGRLADVGALWAATDEEILARSLDRRVTAADLYRPYEVGVGARRVRVLFRDHQLSDLIGFAYQSWNAEDAAADFVQKVRDAGRRFSADTGGDAPVVSVILDGENAWEHYESGGRPFLRALYRRLAEASDIETVTMHEAGAAATVRTLPSIFPGSWINGDFYIWAGHRDDHRAWTQLAAARLLYEENRSRVSPEVAARALEELFIAEGSDWFWWYGDDHSSDHDRAFDDLFRRHVRNVYRALGQVAPDDLHVTNITTEPPPTGPLSIGLLTTPRSDVARSRSFLEWATAVEVPFGGGGGTMHRVAGQLVQSLKVMGDERRFYFRVDGAGLVRRLQAGEVGIAILEEKPHALKLHPTWTCGDAATASVTVDELRAEPGMRVTLSILLTDRDGHVIEQHPASGAFDLEVPTRDHDAVNWLV
jgi:alpha-amylase/alpha-mannosidase (GH57 family)